MAGWARLSWWGACAAIMLGCSGCRQPPPRTEPIRPVRAIRAGDATAVAGREFPGRAKAKSEVDLSFQVSGPLTALAVDVGQVVKAGDVVATVDPRDFQAALDSAQGNLERAQANLLAMERGARPEEIESLRAAVAKAEAANRQAVEEYERFAKLLAEKSVSESETQFRKARADTTAADLRRAQEELNIGLAGARPEDLAAKRSEIRALEGAVAAAENQLGYTRLTAPFGGEVSARYVDNFQTVQAKQPIVRLLDLQAIEVTVQIPETLIGLIPQVQEVAVKFDALPGREFIGKVTKIGSEASQTTRTYPVTVEIPQAEDARILPGMAATVRNHASADRPQIAAGIVIPAGAVFVGDGEQTMVWIYDPTSQRVHRRAVQVGPLKPTGMTILGGLQVGEWVVISGVNSLQEDQEVRLLTEEN